MYTADENCALLNYLLPKFYFQTPRCCQTMLQLQSALLPSNDVVVRNMWRHVTAYNKRNNIKINILVTSQVS